jgi:hypothetical protein
VRILFQLAFPGYLRMYGSTVRLLGERGHTVLLSYDDPEKRRDPAVSAIEAADGVEVVPPLPPASRDREDRVAQLRAVADYLRYLDRRFAPAPYLRRRQDKYLRGGLRALRRIPYGTPGAGSALRAALALERRVPSDRGVEQALAALGPDAVVVTPLLGRSNRNRRQTDTVKSARALGIPVGFGVASWDHLTTKGVVKALPDATFVWNELQRRDAVELHRLPAGSVHVTGAQLFDRWFDTTPSTTGSAFRAGLRLPEGPYVLYVGSSPNIAPPEREIAFVRRWIETLRVDTDLRGVGVVVRPHPYSVEAWAQVDLGPDTAVSPRTPPELPMTEADEALYFNSIHHAAAVVGINTSAMVESFVLRTPVLTIRTEDFRASQEGTLHFGELRTAAGGALQTASSLGEHVSQLRSTIADPARFAAGIAEFLRVFVRPLGLDRPATPILADAIEALASRRPVAAGAPVTRV